jgi:hypothetical protein
MKFLLLLLPLSAVAAAADEDGVLLGAGKLEFIVEERPEETTVSWRPAGNGRVRGIFKLEWLETTAPASFTTSVVEPGRRLVTKLRVGPTTFTRTVLADPGRGAVFLHLLSNMPGSLGFRASFRAGEGAVAIEDRRELVVRTAEGGEAARAWVLPFESDVEPDDGRIVLRGEGEALVILRPGGNAGDLLRRLAAEYDGGRWPPDPIRLWRGLSAVPADAP